MNLLLDVWLFWQVWDQYEIKLFLDVWLFLGIWDQKGGNLLVDFWLFLLIWCREQVNLLLDFCYFDEFKDRKGVRFFYFFFNFISLVMKRYREIVTNIHTSLGNTIQHNTIQDLISLKKINRRRRRRKKRCLITIYNTQNAAYVK